MSRADNLRLVSVPRPARLTRGVVEGWGGGVRAEVFLARAESVDDCVEALEEAAARRLPIIARGGGLSYADGALVEGGVVLDTTGMDRILAFDDADGTITVEPGVRMEALLARTLPAGWVPGALPGAPGVTVGGAIANDVHGKRARGGSFGRHVLELTILTADGRKVRASPDANASLFHGTIGGLGLLGVVVEAKLRLSPAPSEAVRTSTRPVSRLGELRAGFEEARHGAEFALAWVDAHASGSRLGRGWLETARWAEPGVEPGEPLLGRLAAPVLASPLTWDLARPFFGRRSMRAVNAAASMATRISRNSRAIPFERFVFRQAFAAGWRSLYAPRGLVEIQAVFPRPGSFAAIEAVLQLCQRTGFESNVCIVKQHAPERHPLAFAADGHSLTVELPRGPALREKFREPLFELVVRYGGRVNLAKDELLTAPAFRAMFPRASEFLALKAQWDPRRRFLSGLSRRLFPD